MATQHGWPFIQCSDFDSDEKEDVYPEEVSEVVLPLFARFDSLTREEGGR